MGETNQVKPWQSSEFVALCEQHGVKPTRRQFSKYRNGYGALADKVGTHQPRGPFAMGETDVAHNKLASAIRWSMHQARLALQACAASDVAFADALGRTPRAL